MPYKPAYMTKSWAKRPLGNERFARGIKNMVTTFVNTKSPKK